MSKLLSKVRTAWALGVPSLTRFFFYRLGVKFGINSVRRIASDIDKGVFFSETACIRDIKAAEAMSWSIGHDFFHWFHVDETSVPQWFKSSITGLNVKDCSQNWWKIPDFDPDVGDIKAVWEASRFDWVVTFSQKAGNGDLVFLRKLNEWLSDWVLQNKPYVGPNWKCGQEASFRVVHLAMAAVFLGQHKEPTQALVSLIRAHLKRIAPTIQYAIAQNNNHGTSEAAALFIGGSWLALTGNKEGLAWAKQGRTWLENRANGLILDDGSFSQYSVTYHRLMLDTYSFAEVWRQKLGLMEFSTDLRRRLCLAANWLYMMVQTQTGDAPNTGANDGALLLFWGECEYRDFRPSVQLSKALFAGERAYADDGPWNIALEWFGVPLSSSPSPTPCTRIADDGGFAVLRRGSAMAMLRYPRFRFRPSQADALHLDLWLDGKNLLRDAGTYSYNTEKKWLDYFGGTESHNTVQFDERDQMPRLSRFLFGDWLKTSFKAPLVEDSEGIRFGAGYQDRKGGRHIRNIHLTDANLCITDDVSGFGCKAVLRWRLGPGEWRLSGQRLTDGVHVITVKASMPVVRCELVEGWESRHYLEKTPVPVMEIEVHQPGTFTTDYHWAA